MKEIFLFLLSFTLVFPSLNAAEDQKENKGIYFDAAKIEENARLINLRFDPSPKAITLDNTELIEDDAPAVGLPEKYFGIEYRKATAPWQEDLKKGVVIKKILILNDPTAWSGRLLFLGQEKQGNVEPLHLSVNGFHLLRPASQIAYPHACQYTEIEWLRWYFIDLPIGALKKGENEILMWTESESPSWKVCIAVEEEFVRGSLTRIHHPNRSQKSSDAGKTWSDSELGINNSEDGEYNIRLSLDRYVPVGEYVSPVIDVVGDSDILKKYVTSLTAKYFIDIEIPEKTEANAMVRFGVSPLLNDPSWTSWKKVAIGTELIENLGERRHFQWKAELTTNNPLESPVITGMRICSEWEDYSPNEKLGMAAVIVQNGQVIMPSYLYSYENLNHSELQKFRKRFKLDKIVAGAEKEFEIMMRLLHWSYRIPVTENPYSWNSNDIAVYKKGEKEMSKLHWDYEKEKLRELYVLDPGEKGMPQLQWNYEGRRRDATCSFSNIALQGALLSMGYQARFININSEAISGHEVTEVWSNEFNKWFYLDATRDYYYFDLETGLPLNLLEIHNKIAEKVPLIETWQRPFAPETGSKVVQQIKIGMRQGYNPVSIEEHGYHLMETMGYFRIPLRNDFYSNPLPIPIAQGFTMWGWDGYLNHYDEKFPKRTEFQRQSNRFVDFYEPLNQSQLFLSETNQKGVLKVEAATFTPGFETFFVRINNGKWVAKKNAAWHWKLKAGMNKIEVRVRNVRGILGPVSCIKVTYNP